MLTAAQRGKRLQKRLKLREAGNGAPHSCRFRIMPGRKAAQLLEIAWGSLI